MYFAMGMIGVVSGSAVAADPYPSKPVRFIVPFAPAAAPILSRAS